MFLIEVIDVEGTNDRRVRSVGPGDIVIESDSDQPADRSYTLGDLCKHGPVITRNPS